MRATTALAALGTAAVLTGVAACGGGGGDGQAGAYVDALVSKFEEGGDFPFETEQARCLARGFVATVGVDELEEKDITPEELAASDDPTALGLDLGPDEAEGFADTIQGCDLSVGDLFLAGARQSGIEVPDDLAECINDNVDEDAFYDLVAQSIIAEDGIDDAAAGAIFTDVAEACPEFADFGG